MRKLDRLLGPGNLWTLLIGLGFLIWGTIYAIRPNAIFGSYMLFIPGGILFIAAISNIINYRYDRERLLAALSSYQRIDLKQLAYELRMKTKDIKDIIIDLRTEGLVKASFDPESGEVIVLEVNGRQPSQSQLVISEVTPPADNSFTEEISPSMKEIKEQGYCPYCGSRIQSSDKFCVTCGATLE
jgi:DNA-binding MarR family transcriptional regulator